MFRELRPQPRAARPAAEARPSLRKPEAAAKAPGPLVPPAQSRETPWFRLRPRREPDLRRPAAAEAPSVLRAPSPASASAVQTPAEDPRIFDLLRPIEQQKLQEHGLEVETRPERVYERRWPGSDQSDTVRLDYHGVGLLQVATHAHDEIGTRGLGMMFPAHTVHARDSSTVVVGDNCELTQVDHVHIRQAVVADDDALRSGQVEKVLAEAVPGDDNSRVARDLRDTLTRLVERPDEKGPSQAERKLRADCTAEIYDCDSVQLGDDAMTRLDSHYVVERTVIPAGALLADNDDLARRYVDLVTEPAGDPGGMAGFLCDLVGAAQNATDDNILGYADGLPREPATLLGLFGLAVADNMTCIMIGAGNELHTELDLTTSPMRVADGLSQRLDDRRPAAPGPPSPSLAPPRHPQKDGSDQGWW